ncbi:hypothetical protein PHYPSEUDO_010553 [Phytophthora pseudosyringae]|uniref:Elicitin n=1 Tax=Phytophthora pseudosyringae TaxID=221518 RepID=A0A8T1VD95_9STRA|nr:hypothetical protein PHYPSEUDO_010553 [Phytophthora pseudosyringae]
MERCSAPVQWRSQTEEGHVNSLFDVLDFSDQDFLAFCRSSGCTRPVQSLLHAIPTNCLITYHGSARNISDDVLILADKCTAVSRAADRTDEDYIYKYFLD